MFSTLFLNNFTAKEKESELVQQVSMIGAFVEKTLVEDAQGRLDAVTDITKMSATDLRSFLSFFMVLVRNFVNATGKATITVTDAKGTVAIPAGAVLISKTGVVYRQLGSIALGLGQSSEINIAQGEWKSQTGVYNTYITVPAEGIDLSTVRVFVQGKEIDPCYAFDNGVVLPVNGFYPFYYSGVLYVKIFAGEDVPVYEGEPYEVRYVACEGVAGNIDQNSISSYLDNWYDSLGYKVSFSFTNEKIETGQSAPERSELINLLRYWLFVKGSVSKVSDYKTWFLAQPEVKDCAVSGDYEHYLETGEITITGKVRAALVDSFGQGLSNPVIAVIEERLAKVRDIGLTEYVSAVRCYHTWVVRVRAVEDFDAFQTLCRAEIMKYYDITQLQNWGLSVFDDIQTLDILSEVIKQLDPSGLEYKVSYYEEVNLPGSGAGHQFIFYKGRVQISSCTYSYRVGLDIYRFKEGSSFSDTVPIINEANVVVGNHNYSTGVVVLIDPVLADAGLLQIEGIMADQGTLKSGKLFGVRKLQEVRFELY